MIYVRLKPGIIESPKYGKIIYPGETYTSIEDKFKDLVENDERLEVLTQDEMNALNIQQEARIKQFAKLHPKKLKKELEKITDIKFLKSAMQLCIDAENDDNTQLVLDRINELKYGIPAIETGKPKYFVI
ncbi:hypothetical protein EDC14_100652 [Hydrogenispora ethanolica]|uniref:Uncharacterized protein n=1 Tax=Hydrogenispora ethanolica TaxID=1082276 RepID=A0A4R1S207_HYDET|nr:hypothetical protein [Hydrogenispora ethanolica]TCL72342.1 hypothetical protein EDC14_100652 [Hydrogenispora ethanolica]